MGIGRTFTTRLFAAATLAIAAVPIDSTRVAADEVVYAQTSCQAGEIAVSGVVTNGGSGYQTIVEFRFSSASTIPFTSPWLSRPGSLHFDGAVASTDASGSYTLCVPTTVEYNGSPEPVLRVQVLAHADLSGWDGSSAPSVGLTAGAVLEMSQCSGGCSSDIVMSAPTIWSFSSADVMYLFGDSGYVTNLSGYIPVADGSMIQRGKLAAAYPFSPNTNYRYETYTFSTGRYREYEGNSDYVFSGQFGSGSEGSVIQIQPPNFVAELNYPAAVPEPVRNIDGTWPLNSWPTVYLIRLDGNCANGGYLSFPSCFQTTIRHEPLTIEAQLAPNVPYALAATKGILPITSRILIMLEDGRLMLGRSEEELQGNPTFVSGPFTKANPFVLNMDPPKFFIGGFEQSDLISAVSASAEKWSLDGCDGSGCFQWVPAEQPARGENGVLGWSPSEGIWRVVFNSTPNVEFTAGGPNWARTESYVKVETSNGVPLISATCTYANAVPECSGEAPTSNADGVAQFAVGRANVIVNVVGLDGNPVPQRAIDIGPAAQDWPEYGAPTTTRGAVGLNLAPGQWKLIARAPDGDLDQADGLLVFEVTADSTAENPQSVTISLSEPNVKGRVLKPDNSPSRFSGVQVQVFDAGMNGPRNIRWAPTDLNGNFAINLEAGTYKLTLDPPPTAPGIPRTSFFVKVDADSVPCLVSDFADATCNEPSPEDRFTFVFSSPNFSGRLLLDSGSGVSGWVSADSWNGVRFGWADIGAQVDSSGNFALVLADNTTYRIVAEPRASSGASRSTIYITMGSGGQWCQTTADPITETPASCTPAANGTLTIQAPGANFRGSVSAANTSITQGWVDASVETDFGWRFFEGAQVKRDGTFAIRIDRPGSEWQQVKVTANPPWGNSSLVKKSQLYWVRGTDICADVAKPNPTCSSLVLTSDVQAFVLTGGNVSGVVSMPGSGDPAEFVHISVEKQNAEGWWEWVDVWAQTDVNGAYSLGLDDGQYRITARPFNRDGVSPTSISLTVDATCTGCAAADITLSPPNVTATIRTPGGAASVSGAWVSVERKKINCRDQDCTVSDVWWEWTGYGAESNAQGAVAISVPVSATSADYRLVVQSPWSSQTIYPRFVSDEFTLVDGGPTEKQFVNLDFPSANVNVELFNGQDNVANSWVGIERWNGQYWQWFEVGSHTGVSGKVSLYLPCLNDQNPCNPADYRLVVDSPWGASTALPRFTKSLADVFNTPAVNNFHPVSFPSTNVSGRVMIDTNTFNRNGWIEVFEWGDLDNDVNTPDEMGSWLTGNPVNRQGKFAMFLADGTYLLRAQPNGSIAATPIEVIVVVANGEFSSCNYRLDGATCSRNDFDIDLSFDERPKNLSLTVTYNGQPLTRSAFVTLESPSEGVSISLVTDETGAILATVRAANDYSISVVLPTGGSNVVNGSLTNQVIGSEYSENRTAITVALQ